MHIIDLLAQEEAFNALTHGWTDEEKLDLLRQWGTVVELELPPHLAQDMPRTFYFESWIGMRMTFFLRDGRLGLPGMRAPPLLS